MFATGRLESRSASGRGAIVAMQRHGALSDQLPGFDETAVRFWCQTPTSRHERLRDGLVHHLVLVFLCMNVAPGAWGLPASARHAVTTAFTPACVLAQVRPQRVLVVGLLAF